MVVTVYIYASISFSLHSEWPHNSSVAKHYYDLSKSIVGEQFDFVRVLVYRTLIIAVS